MDLLESFSSSLHPSDAAKSAIGDYFQWQTHHSSADFTPTAEDDVDLRTYLFDLRMNGADLPALEEQVRALEQFYQWAQTEGVINDNPFNDYNFDPHFLASTQIHERQQALPGNMDKREVDRLSALSQISEQLNSSVDIQSALDNTLKTLLKVMNLQTGWVSMLVDSHLGVARAENAPPHGFTLAAAHGLPPGLEQNDRRVLRQPPACHCQHLLMEGHFTRAVNIVECTRLRNSIGTDSDTQGLRFHASVPLISQGKPIGILNCAATEWQFLTPADLHFLSAVSTQLVVAIERAHFYEIAEARRILLENELTVAREVQAGLMPREMPDIPGFHLAGAWHPAREVAGDLYNIFPLDKGRWGVLIGDVVDKGTAAALYMAMLDSLILSGALRHLSPATVLMEVNQAILRQWQSTGMFATAFLGVLDPKDYTLQYANAGHNPPMLRRASGTIESLTKTGHALGLFDELQMSERTITLAPGDAVVLYTDGVTEAYSPQRNEEYGADHLTAAISTAPRNAVELLTHIEADLNAFMDGAPQHDDETWFVLTKD